MAEQKVILLINGGYKTGSTHVFNVLISLLDQKVDMQNRSVHNIYNPDWRSLNYKSASKATVVKTHTMCSRPVAELQSKGFKVIVLWTMRDLTNRISSHYWHFINEKFWIPRFLYASTIGVVKALEMLHYDYEIRKFETLVEVHRFNYTKNEKELRGWLTSIFNNTDVDLELDLLSCNKQSERSSLDTSLFGGENRHWFTKRVEKKYRLFRFCSRLSESLFFITKIFKLGVIIKIIRCKS